MSDSPTQSILVLDFGSQYTQLIARRIRELKVHCEIHPYNLPLERVRAIAPIGIVLSGGPASVGGVGAPLPDPGLLDTDAPILGVCYGMQFLAEALGGRVEAAGRREYGRAEIELSADCRLFAGFDATEPLQVWMSHGDHVAATPPGFEVVAHTGNGLVAAFQDTEKRRYGVQFHPEVSHTPRGMEILKNFLFEVCEARPDWTPSSFVRQSVGRIREQVGSGHVVCGLSGGVDSAVAAALIHKAIGDQITCIFVDNGLLRRGEFDDVVHTFRDLMHIPVRAIDAGDRFLSSLAGVTDPEAKRKAIGADFIAVFEQEARGIENATFLAQGTLYPDVIESKTSENEVSAKIKTHHNVGGLPENMKMDLVEPLRYLFKDEVREVGLELGLAEEMVYRQPFPGPGLAIRVMGDVTYEKLETLRAADWIVMDEIKANGLYRDLWQSFAVLTGSRSVGVTGDFRTYGNVIAVRAVESDEAMTADWARLPHEVLARISSRIVNEVPDVNRVVYDITSKPPGTIEWE